MRGFFHPTQPGKEVLTRRGWKIPTTPCFFLFSNPSPDPSKQEQAGAHVHRFMKNNKTIHLNGCLFFLPEPQRFPPAVNRAADQGLIRSHGLRSGQRQRCNALQNRTSHQGKVNCDHSHADRSTARSIHPLPPPVRVDVIACAAALGSAPPSTSSAAARLLLPGTSLRLLSRSRNRRFSHIVKD